MFCEYRHFATLWALRAFLLRPQHRSGGAGVPLVIDRLNDEAQRGAHRVDVFPHDFLHNGCLARIVKSSRKPICQHSDGSICRWKPGVSPRRRRQDLQHQDSHLLFLQPGLSQNRQHGGGGQWRGMLEGQLKVNSAYALWQTVHV